MTQLQLDSAVAAATGESIASIRRRGFSIVSSGAADLAPENLALVVACPHCRRHVVDPGRTCDGAPLLAECLDCNVSFAATPSLASAAS